MSSFANCRSFFTTLDPSTALSLNVRHKDILYLANPIPSLPSSSPLEAESAYLTSVCVNPLRSSSSLIEYGLSSNLSSSPSSSPFVVASDKSPNTPSLSPSAHFQQVIPLPYASVRIAHGITIQCANFTNLPLSLRNTYGQLILYQLDNCPVTIGSVIRLPRIRMHSKDNETEDDGEGEKDAANLSDDGKRDNDEIVIEITRTNPPLTTVGTNNNTGTKKLLSTATLLPFVLRIAAGQTRISWEQDIQNRIAVSSPGGVPSSSAISPVPVASKTPSLLPSSITSPLSPAVPVSASPSKDSLFALSPWKTGGKIEYNRGGASSTNSPLRPSASESTTNGPSTVTNVLSSSSFSSSLPQPEPPSPIPSPSPSSSLMDQLHSLMIPSISSSSTSSSSIIAGLEEPLQLLREMVILPILYPHVLQSIGLDVPKGVLLHGPPGCGKTLLVTSIVNEASSAIGTEKVKLFSVQGPEILSPVMGESEEKLRKIFTDAENYSIKAEGISIIFFDEIDALCPRRFNAQGKVASMGTTSLSVSRVVTQLLTLMDGLRTIHSSSLVSPTVSMKPSVRIVVIAATNRIDSLDSALRRPGRFDREVRIDPPHTDARLRILQLHTQKLQLDDSLIRSNYLATLANKCIGYVGADLLALCREASSIAMKRYLHHHRPNPSSSYSSSSSSASLPPLSLIADDFELALSHVGPSALRGYLHRANDNGNAQTVTWESIGGMKEVIQRLREAVEYPLQFTDLYRQMRLHSPRGILLYGPPGNSKTTLVKALANAVSASFFALSSADIISPYVGEAERLLRLLFTRAREASPSLIFLDEIDALVGKRGIGESSAHRKDTSLGLLATLLTEMDGVVSTGNVIVIAATNRPEVLDPALTRPGRFEIRISVPSPTEEGRKEILAIHSRRMRLGTDVDLPFWAKPEHTEEWSGAQLENLCREAAMEALRENLTADTVHNRHFERAWKALTTSG